MAKRTLLWTLKRLSIPFEEILHPALQHLKVKQRGKHYIFVSISLRIGIAIAIFQDPQNFVQILFTNWQNDLYSFEKILLENLIFRSFKYHHNSKTYLQSNFFNLL